jgi:hypothetical protein
MMGASQSDVEQVLKPDVSAGQRHHQSQTTGSFVVHNAWLIGLKQCLPLCFVGEWYMNTEYHYVIRV